MPRLYRILLFLAALSTSQLAADTIDYGRDIRPIFAANCFACHGPDEQARAADLRLDQRESAIDQGAIVASNPADSELIQRIDSNDAELVMPPPDSHKKLTDQEKRLLREWIAQGAAYADHWAFVAPKRPTVPKVEGRGIVRNAIDAFVLQRLDAANLKQSVAADRYTLARRVYLDLIGLPPTLEQADAFASDTNPDAYENLVDRLLASPRYGERWARPWLDLARYSDTNGYEKDRERSIWPYRDWVIKALNDDMPYDQFSIEQLAGDMLPNPTESQLVATGFHRNTMLNEEGGIDPLEYRFYAVVDRVATTGTVWLGLTTGCAQCHTHKYDPITHTDYYRLFALLNNADEPDLFLKPPSVLKRRLQIERRIKSLTADLANRFPPGDGDGTEAQRREEHLEQKFAAWLAQQRTSVRDWRTIRPTSMKSNLPKLTLEPDGAVFSSGDVTKRDVYQLEFDLSSSDLKFPLTALRLEALPDDRLPARGPGRAYYEGRKGDFFLSELTGEFEGVPVSFIAPSRSYGKIAVGSGDGVAKNVLDNKGSTGWSTAQREGEPHQLVLNLAHPIEKPGRLKIEMLFERHFVASLGRFRFAATSADSTSTAKQLPVQIESLLAKTEMDASEREQVFAFYLTVATELADAHEKIAKLRKQLEAFPATMVMQERPDDNRRPTHRHHRGEYLSPREAVTPDVPQFLKKDGEQAITNRLQLARWLVSRENPLAARVAVNRAWQEFFGDGFLKTSGDFGTQSPSPSHPQLLDWLACELIDDGWSMKRLHRRIVTSAAYRQESNSALEDRQTDPTNKWLARGPRHRLSGESVRDVMLHASGLLSSKMFGPSVRPPQPEIVVKVTYGNPGWASSQGEDRFRRSLYTFSKRTAPFAAYALFDAPSGENCIARRDRSNTPLQALTLLNDPMYLEMAEALAKLAMQEGTNDIDIATLVLRRLLTRPPTAEEVDGIVDFYQQQVQRLDDGELDSQQIAKTHSSEQAAWTMTARAVMNLDEVITKP